MNELCEKIRFDFKDHSIIEVFVLDENGDPLEIFGGPVGELTPALLGEALAQPGCFYVFSIVGVPHDLVNSNKLSRDNMIRKEFCWLTQPDKPRMVNRAGRKSMCVVWDEVKCCGLDVSMVAPALNYSIEVAQGHDWKGGVNYPAGFATGTEKEENFRLMARGVGMTTLTVEDLSPAIWFHWRLCVEYMGKKVYSEVAHFATLPSVPEPTNVPEVRKLTAMSPVDPKVKAERDPKMLVKWTSPRSNGSKVILFQLQMKLDLDIDLVGPEDFGHAPIAGGRSDEEDDGSHMGMIGLIPQALPKEALSQWNTVYYHRATFCELATPAVGVRGVHLRVRAKNGEGWSDFSPVLSISRTNYPSLFRFLPESRKGARGKTSSTPTLQPITGTETTIETIPGDKPSSPGKKTRKGKEKDFISAEDALVAANLKAVSLSVGIPVSGDFLEKVLEKELRYAANARVIGLK